MEILSELQSRVWEDRHAWAAEVLELAASNEVKIEGIREFKNRLHARELTTDDTVWLLDVVNKGLEPSGVWLHYRLGLVMD